MNALSFFVLFIVILQVYHIDSRKFLLHDQKAKSQTQSLKQSVPFSQVLQNAVTLMGSTYASQIDSELENLRALSQDEIIDYFKATTYNGDVQLYWFRYYLLAQLALFENRAWTRPEGEGLDPEDINDPNFRCFKYFLIFFLLKFKIFQFVQVL